VTISTTSSRVDFPMLLMTDSPILWFRSDKPDPNLCDVPVLEQGSNFEDENNRKRRTSVPCCCTNFNHHAKVNSTPSQIFDRPRRPSRQYTRPPGGLSSSQRVYALSSSTTTSVQPIPPSTTVSRWRRHPMAFACVVGDSPPERSSTPDSTQGNSLFGFTRQTSFK
jgi:hypothetical protein